MISLQTIKQRIAPLTPRAILNEWEESYWKAYHPDDDFVVPVKARIAFAIQNRLDRARAIRFVLTDFSKASFSESSSLSAHQELFYRFKAALCLVLDLQPKEEPYLLDDISVVWFDLEEYWSQEGQGGTCQEVRVGSGFRTNWWCFVELESWP